MNSSEDDYRSFAEGALRFLIHIDGDFNITAVSDETVNYIEMPRDALVGQPLQSLVAPEIYPDVEESLLHAAETGQPTRFETVFLQSEGRRFPQEVVVIPFRNDGAPVYWLMGACVDFASEAEPATALSRSYYELRMLHQISNTILTTLDLNRIIFAILTCVTAHPALGFTRAFLFIADWKQNRLRGKMAVGPRSAEEAYRTWGELGSVEWSIQDFIDRYDTLVSAGQFPLSDAVTHFSARLDNKEDVLIRTLHENKPRIVLPEDGASQLSEELRHLMADSEIVIVPLSVKGQVIALIVADNAYKQRPITDEDVHVLTVFANHVALVLNNAANYEELQEKMSLLEKMQARLIQSERLSTVGEMATQVAHEIRNPLVAIGAMAQNMLKKTGEDDRNYSKIMTIVKESERLENILREMLEYNRPRVLCLEESNLGELIEESCRFVGDQHQKQPVTIDCQVDPNAPRCRIDRYKITQVLMNVLTNAVDAIDKGGEIRVWVEAHEHGCVIHIQDNGAGIPEEVLPRIFTPFYTTKSHGLGIGLSLSREIVQAHAGCVDVESEPGKGTHFKIVLPRDPEKVPEFTSPEG